MPSSRYRVYQFLPYLRSQEIDFDIYSAVPEKMFKYLYNTGNFVGNLSYIFSEITYRISQLFKSGLYDVVFIQKSLTSINLKGLPALLKGKRVIFDVDDNIFPQPVNTFSSNFLRKFQDWNQAFYLARISKAVIVGNRFLQDLLPPCNKNIHLIPTSVDTDRFIPNCNKSNKNGKIVIGWMGSPSTSPYLKMLTGVFRKLQEKYPIGIGIIGDANIVLEGVKLHSETWNYQEEVKHLQGFDIGIMPMPDNDWTRGKCGLKALQYMAVGIPTVCSPVGVNKEIIQDGVNGFLANGEEWIEKLSALIENSCLRKELGQAGREAVEKKYSLKVNAPKLKYVVEEAGKA